MKSKWPPSVASFLPTARKGNVFTSVCQSFCPQSALRLLGHCSYLLWCSRYTSYWNAFLFPPANVVCKGYVFTGVCLSTGGCYPSMPCSRSLGEEGVVSQHALQVSRPTPKGEVEGDLVQAHTQRGS